MDKNDSKKLAGMSDEQLALTLLDTEKRLFDLRFAAATDKLETPSEIRRAKRGIARIKTVQRQRELVRLAALPDADLDGQTTALEARIEGPGKRRIKRGLARLAAIKAERDTKKGSSK